MRTQPLTQAFPYLPLDAIFLDARWARTVQNVSALVAYSVGVDGHRHLLAILVGVSESVNSWLELLRQLMEFGLMGVRLVIADGHAGLPAAARQALPQEKPQCPSPATCSPRSLVAELVKIAKELVREGSDLRKLIAGAARE